ncbi:hypothetical protein MRX96_007420 [Rhipicephalus microplus]
MSSLGRRRSRMFSVSWGSHASDSPASNRAADVDYYGIGGMSCQAQGSKENFVGGFHSHLYEDGPDPTPRTVR